MRQSILVLLLASIATAFGAGCATTTLPDVATDFEPRVYPYVPEISPEGKNLPDPVTSVSK